MTSPTLTQPQRAALEWLPPQGECCPMYPKQMRSALVELEALGLGASDTVRVKGVAWDFWRITPAGEALRKEIVGT